MRRASDGFTLLEVLVSTVLLVAGLLSVILLFPAGIRAQQQARNQMYASVKAMELADAFSQHALRFGDRMHVLENTTDNIWRVHARAVGLGMLREAAYGSRVRYDLENVASAGGLNGFYPVPLDIARRLDSPGGTIAKVLDQGGYLYYPDPRPVRGFSRSEATNPASSRNAPELQRLVFAVVGYPQQNCLVQHPLYQFPYYRLWPFAPDGTEIFALNLSEVDFTDNQPSEEADTDKLRYGSDLLNWAFFAEVPAYGTALAYRDAARPGVDMDANPGGRFGASPWSDSWRAFLNLCVYGHMPISFKFTRRPVSDSNVANLPPRGIKIPDAFWPKRMGLKLAGTRTQADPLNLATNGDLLASIRATASAPVLPSRYADIVDLINGYDPAKEQGDAAAPRLPSYELRLLYRRLAEQLWRDVVQAAPLAGTAADLAVYQAAAQPVPTADPANPSVALNQSDPLQDDLGDPLPAQLHPARVMALSYLAHAAIMVTGHRSPLQQPAAPPTDWQRPYLDTANFTVMTAPGTAVVAPDYAGGFSEATTDDYRKARRAQENALRWAVAYRNRFPDCHIVPCVANRQTFTDTPMYQFDLFDAAGQARRISQPRQVTLATWSHGSNAYALPSYFLLPRRFVSPSAQNYLDLQPSHLPAAGPASNSALAGDRASLIGPGMFVLGTAHSYMRATANAGAMWFETAGSPAGFPANLTNRVQQWECRLGGNHRQAGRLDSCAPDETLCGPPATAGRYWVNARFDAQARMRQIVCWAVDWKRYEDAESAPSAPIDVSSVSNKLIRSRIAGGMANAAWTDFDPPETPLVWFGRDRRWTFEQIFSGQGGEVIQGFNVGSQGIQFTGGQGVGQSAGFTFRQAGVIELVDREMIGHVFGQFGADRNGNTRFDRGDLKASTRLRATEVARFNYYDPVAWTHLRN